MSVQIEEQTNNILIFQLFEKETHAYIKYYINLDDYELVVSGEITSSYKWVSGTKENFIDLLLRCDENYLIMKLGYSIPKKFNLEKSIEETINNLKESDLSEIISDEFYELISEIKNIDAFYDCDFYQQVLEIMDTYLVNGDYYDCIECIMDYPYWLIKSIKLFCSNIKPLLKLKNNMKGENK